MPLCSTWASAHLLSTSALAAWSSAWQATIKRLPGSLDEALRALEADHDFLLAGGVFSRDLIERWVKHKREAEYYAVRNRPHPYEVNLYFGV